MSGPVAVPPWYGVDWRAPWLEPWAESAAWLGAADAIDFAAVHGYQTVFSALNGLKKSALDLSSSAPQFVSQGALPEGEGYEAFIHRTGSVPTRDNLHDFFNGLVWLRFPRSKAHCNRLHAQEISRLGGQSPRGPVRDALTVFDENGAVLQCPDALWQALADKDWQRLFVTERGLWQQARLVLFGHALLEKLVAPRKAMVTHVYRVDCGFGESGQAREASEFIAPADDCLVQHLTPDVLAAKPFVPLPVLGVPGWWPANEDPAFYEDRAVFRRP